MLLGRLPVGGDPSFASIGCAKKEQSPVPFGAYARGCFTVEADNSSHGEGGYVRVLHTPVLRLVTTLAGEIAGEIHVEVLVI